MATIKNREVYGLRNFRGLDKENKPLKVQPFRASDGYNFVIESGGLKTRPAFKYVGKPSFDFEEGDYIIDWYKYNKISVYITKKHIYIEDGENLFKETDNNSLLSFSVFGGLDFEGLTPLFIEEKNSLFIFCLNNIFVFSVIRKEDGSVVKYVLYELKNKHQNPFPIESEYHQKFEDLPIPYEPTLFIGNNRLDDVNLLSNASKYELFAENGRLEEGEVVYKLPTHYDVKKHSKDGLNKGFKEKITFYGGRFDEYETIPVFLGIIGEHFPNDTNITLEYGTPHYKELYIRDTYFSNNIFEYIRDGETETIVKGITGLTKKEFFLMKEKETQMSVFEYMLDMAKKDIKQKEVDTLTIDSMPSLSGNIGISLDGVLTNVSVNGGVRAKLSLTITETSPIATNWGLFLNGVYYNIELNGGETIYDIGSKIRGMSFDGWATSGDENVIIFTAINPGVAIHNVLIPDHGLEEPLEVIDEGVNPDNIEGVANKIKQAFQDNLFWDVNGSGNKVVFTNKEYGEVLAPLFFGGGTGVEGTFEQTFLGNDYVENKVIKFILEVQVNSNVRDKDTNNLVQTKVEKKNFEVYIQAKRFENNEVSFVDENLLVSNTLIAEEGSVNPYPPSPPFASVDKIYYIPQGFEELEMTEQEFAYESKKKVIEEIENINNEEKVAVIAKTFEKITQFEDTSISLNASNTWYKKFSDIGFPSYNDNFQETPPLTVVGRDTTINVSGESVNWNSAYMQNQIKNEILYFLEETLDLVNDEGSAFLKIRVRQTYISDFETLQSETIYWSIVLKFFYKRAKEYTREKRTTRVYTTKILKGSKQPMKLYSFDYNSYEKSFVLKVKDYFIDYNNEPGIKVRVAFDENPDYELIARNKFGITFGSENRLFLAGNSDFPNIDRYNVSNNLLGDNVKNQSYELSYFPSKNYRPLGGPGAINGYVVANDTQLYITKEDYPNDNKLFIRDRILDENGVVGYREYKTNINKTPLNNKTILNFYNDVLMLTEEGLYAIEISGNVLTNERLIKMRSGFINKTLKEKIKKVDKNKVFVYESNNYLYIFIEESVFVADVRFVDVNPNSEIGNTNYEIVEWKAPLSFKNIKVFDGEQYLLDFSGKYIYSLKDDNEDDVVERKKNFLSCEKFDGKNETFFFGDSLFSQWINKKNITFTFDRDDIYKLLALETTDYSFTIVGNKTIFTINNQYPFRNLKNGDKIFLKNSSSFVEKEVLYFDENFRESFVIEDIPLVFEKSELYISVNKKRLYPKIIFEKYNDSDVRRAILSPYNDFEVIYISKEEGESEEDYIDRIIASDNDYSTYVFADGLQITRDVIANFGEKIKLKWISAVLDFNKSLYEKTMFKTFLYATRLSKENIVKIGYRTMRRHDRFDEEDVNGMMIKVDVSNAMNFDEVFFNIYSLNTFNEMGTSIPTKENNFLYIQVMIVGEGNIEVNSLEMLYKANRLLKTSS